MPDRDGCQAHQGAVAGRVGVRGAGQSGTGATERVERRAGGIADVEAHSGAGVGATLVPVREAAHQVGSIERRVVLQAIGQGQRHGGVIRPLTAL